MLQNSCKLNFNTAFTLLCTCFLLTILSTGLSAKTDKKDIKKEEGKPIVKPCFRTGLDSTLWVRRTPEYKVITTAVYKNAITQLKQLVAEEKKNGIPVTKLAVVMDVDETILDNSLYTARRIAAGKSTFSPASWNKWVLSRQGVLIPGAKMYIDQARKLGITVYLVSNRSMHSAPKSELLEEQTATLDNLKKYGLDFLPKHLLLDQETAALNEGMSNISIGPVWNRSKIYRRAYIARNYKIIQTVGDDLNDHTPARLNSQTARLQAAESQKSKWGIQWIVLPNPMYGSWTKPYKADTPAKSVELKIKDLTQ